MMRTGHFFVAVTQTSCQIVSNYSWPPIAEGIEWFIEDQAFPPSYDLAPPMPAKCYPTLSSVSSTGHRTGRLRKRQLADGRRREEVAMKPTIWRRESLVLYKLFHTLWPIAWNFERVYLAYFYRRIITVVTMNFDTFTVLYLCCILQQGKETGIAAVGFYNWNYSVPVCGVYENMFK